MLRPLFYGKISVVMYTDTEGVVLRQTKTVNGRRMIVLFSKQYGKISAGTSISERGKNKTALALRPFTYGRYELFKNRDTYNINGAETLQSYYQIGEDVDKFMCASYVLELTDRLLPEDQPAPAMLTLLLDFFTLLAKRKTSYETLVIGFQLRALTLAGVAPELDNPDELDERFKDIDSEALDALRFISKHPIASLDGIGLKPDVERQLRASLKAYYSYHLGIDNLKSEGLRI